MRIAWFTPAVGDSGIVEYSRRVLAAMRVVADPVLFSHGPPEGFPAGVPTVDYEADPAALAELPRYDAVFYNLGNHPHYHGPIWDVSRTYPGIHILHDRVLHHFYFGHLVDNRHEPDTYRRTMIEHYGWRGAAFAERMLSREPTLRPGNLEIGEFDFLGVAARGAKAVVVHSSWHAEAVRAAWRGPVCTLWLPAHGAPTVAVAASEGRLKANDQRVMLLTLGHVEFNKHPDKVVSVLARDGRLADRAEYVIAGPAHPDLPYVHELGAAIAAASLGHTVSLIGYLSPAELDRWAAAADVFVNLRDPNFEGCSASLMYQLPLGKPVVVYRTGSFAELPDDVVVKVTPGDERELARALRELVYNPARRAQVGSAGRRFAEAKSVQNYVKELLAFVQELGATTAQTRVTTRVGQELAALSIDPRLVSLPHLDAEMLKLFGVCRR
jgi:glycosyltransferase involved in cell wall biosynthesis